MQLGARTRDWEDKTVATKCSKCGRARNTVPVEGKAMMAATTSAAGKTLLTVENVQEAVVKALDTHAQAAAAFAGMHEFERGNEFGLGPSRLAQILNWIEWIIVTVGILSIFVFIIALWGEIMGEIGKEAVAILKNVAWTAFTYALACGSMVKAILVIFVVGL